METPGSWIQPWWANTWPSFGSHRWYPFLPSSPSPELSLHSSRNWKAIYWPNCLLLWHLCQPPLPNCSEPLQYEPATLPVPAPHPGPVPRRETTPERCKSTPTTSPAWPGREEAGTELMWQLKTSGPSPWQIRSGRPGFQDTRHGPQQTLDSYRPGSRRTRWVGFWGSRLSGEKEDDVYDIVMPARGACLCHPLCALHSPAGLGTLVSAKLQMGKPRQEEGEQETQDHAASGREGIGTWLHGAPGPLAFRCRPSNVNIWGENVSGWQWPPPTCT